MHSSGIPALDDTLKGIWAGDNIVFQIEENQDALPFVRRFCQYAYDTGKTMVYFRFADHPPFLPEDAPAQYYQLHPQISFEQFITEVLEAIDRHGKEAYYLFDCLSGLAVDWYTDRMLSNFFRITCPYVYEYGAIAYFFLLRNSHRPETINLIHQTAQVVVDIFRRNEQFYILPLKVFDRHSSTIYMLHSWENDEFRPVTQSAVLADILSGITQPSIHFDKSNRDTWAKTMLHAQKRLDILQKNEMYPEDTDGFNLHLIKMLITRDERLVHLCERYFDLIDLVMIARRMIGTGLIGGKAVGMLLARKILTTADPSFVKRLEQHDSFFIGSDVFYTYLIQNNCWWDKHYLKKSTQFFEDAARIQEKLLQGSFAPDILDQFREMLSYFGQSPIVVRSSSLLEDAYGNSFSGKYESIFCANQGTPEERLHGFMHAVRTIYASTLSREALAYRIRRGLINQDEQMALLVQRVSGQVYDSLYFPHIGGVGYSFNPFVWHQKIDPTQGMLRLVFGLGTRAVERHDDDYTRVVALNAPLLRPEGSSDEMRRYSQKIVNVLDLKANKHISCTFEDVVKHVPSLPLDMFATRDFAMESRAKALRIKNVFSYVLSFEKLLTKTPFVQEMQTIFSLLNTAYDHAVDIEFTVNFLPDGDYRIHLLQCRPFQFTGKLHHIRLPENIAEQDMLLKTRGPIIGQSIMESFDRLIYVIPEKYGSMSSSDRHAVARLIGRLTNLDDAPHNIMLIGPGRWGTQMPELGVPVSFSEIQNVSALVEIAKMHEGLTPDLSLGTHFFNDIVEMNILYMGVAPGKQEGLFNEDILQAIPNRLSQLLPDNANWEEAVHVIDAADISSGSRILLYADTLEQQGMVFISD